MTLYKGSIISCAWCKEELFKLLNDIESGEVLISDDVCAVGNVTQPGQYFPRNCFYCHEPFYLDKCLHTTSGWWPHKPRFFNKELLVPE